MMVDTKQNEGRKLKLLIKLPIPSFIILFGIHPFDCKDVKKESGNRVQSKTSDSTE
jgi:hypothetical protein